MLKVNEIIKLKGYTKAKVAIMANIPQNDFYQATNGKKSFFPKWRKAVSSVLGMSEEELFPEYCNKPKVQEAV
jgi:predicted transcriptional regulator